MTYDQIRNVFEFFTVGIKVWREETFASTFVAITRPRESLFCLVSVILSQNAEDYESYRASPLNIARWKDVINRCESTRIYIYMKNVTRYMYIYIDRIREKKGINT